MSTVSHRGDASADCPSSVTQAIGQRMLQVVLCHVQANDGGNQFFMTAEFVPLRHTAYKQTQSPTLSPRQRPLSAWNEDVSQILAIYICTLTFTLALGQIQISRQVYPFMTWNHHIVQAFSRNSAEHPSRWRRPVTFTGKEASRGEREHDGSSLQHLS